MKKLLLQREQFCAFLFCFVGFLTFYGCNCQAGEAAQPSTFCNPLNLPYRFSLEFPSRREAADPTILRWNNEYWLFASKSGGYWHFSDFVHWTLVVPSGLPIENYAPDAEVINGRMYFTGVGTGMFTTNDPALGQWTPVGSLQGNQDPALFVDSDGKVYFYYGSSATDPIKGVELDASSFAVDSVNDSGVTVGTQLVQAGAIDPLPRAGRVASASMSSVQDPPVNAIDGNPNILVGQQARAKPAANGSKSIWVPQKPSATLSSTMLAHLATTLADIRSLFLRTTSTGAIPSLPDQGPPPSRPSAFLLKQLASFALRKLLTALLPCSGAFTNLTFMDSK